MSSSNKSEKTKAKIEKKRIKAEVKRARNGTDGSGEERASPAVRYAESVRGALYVLTGITLLVALVLGQRGVFVSLDDLIDSLFVARAGKIVLVLIAAALLIYGLKHLRIVR